MISLICSIIISVYSIKTMLLPLKLLDLIKFCLQPFFFEIKSIFISNNTKKLKEESFVSIT